LVAHRTSDLAEGEAEGCGMSSLVGCGAET